MGTLVSRLLFGLIRAVLVPLTMIQRLPIALLFFIGFMLIWIIAKLTRLNRLLVAYVKMSMGIYLFMNGIRLKVDKQVIADCEDKVLIVNSMNPFDMILLFKALPYRKITVMPPQFFSKGWMRYAFYALGIYPAETLYDIRNYKQKPFRLDRYLKAEFTLAEGVAIMNQDVEPIPYSVMLALKHKKPIRCLMMKGSEQRTWATFFTRKTIRLSVLGDIPVGRRPQMAILLYQNHLKTYVAYERTRDPRPFTKLKFGPEKPIYGVPNVGMLDQR
ncbi:hypothetical protein HOH87_07050 [bacterium]|jgi:hypothetical protein|nr:hypothetical protein [bacterium]